MNNSDLQPGKVNLQIYKGATFDRLWLVKYPATDTTFFEPGDQAVMQLRPTVDAPNSAIICTASTINGKLLIDQPNAELRVLIPYLETNFFAGNTAVYDLEIHHPATHSKWPNQVTILLSGKVKMVNNVTRTTVYDYFGDLFTSLTQFAFIRDSIPGEPLSIETGASGAVPVANRRAIRGQVPVSLGATAGDFENNNLVFYDGTGSPLTKGVAGVVQWVSPTLFTLTAPRVLGDAVYMAH